MRFYCSSAELIGGKRPKAHFTASCRCRTLANRRIAGTTLRLVERDFSLPRCLRESCRLSSGRVAALPSAFLNHPRDAMLRKARDPPLPPL